MIKDPKDVLNAHADLCPPLPKRKVFPLVLTLLLILPLLSACGPTTDQLKISALEHFNRGNRYYEMNLLNQAASEYQMAIAQDPTQESFYYNLGLVYYALVLYDKAIDQYTTAIKLNPGFGQAWYNLALSYEKTDDLERAFWAYERYRKINQNKRAVRTTGTKPSAKLSATKKD